MESIISYNVMKEVNTVIKYKINKLALLSVFLLISLNSCGRIDKATLSKNEASVISSVDTTYKPSTDVSTTASVLQTQTTEKIPETTTKVTTVTTLLETDKTFEEWTESEMETIKLLYMDVFNCHEEEANSFIWKMLDASKKYRNNVFGEIVSEEDAKEKGKIVISQMYGEDFIADLESDYVILNGEQIKIERENPPYSVTYYEQYDVWTVIPICKSGKAENGKYIASPNEMSYVAMSASDGKVLAILI